MLMDYSHSSDAELLQQIVRQDEDALSELYSRYCDLVYSFARHALQDTGLAEEATQDTFLKIWRQSAQWNPKLGSFVSWLLTITRYTAIDRLRKERRHSTQAALFSETTSEELHTHSLSDEPEWEDGHWIRALLRQLPSEQAQVIELGFFQGMTHRDIAAVLRVPLGTVKGRSRLGLLKLRNLWLALTKSEAADAVPSDRSYNKDNER